jgi:hypothetical protein
MAAESRACSDDDILYYEKLIEPYKYNISCAMTTDVKFYFLRRYIDDIECSLPLISPEIKDSISNIIDTSIESIFDYVINLEIMLLIKRDEISKKYSEHMKSIMISSKYKILDIIENMKVGYDHINRNDNEYITDIIKNIQEITDYYWYYYKNGNSYRVVDDSESDDDEDESDDDY